MSEINTNQIKGLATGSASGSFGGVSSGIYVLNNGVTLGLFNTVNFQGIGITGVASGTIANVIFTGVPGATGPVGPTGPPGPGFSGTVNSSWERFFLTMGS